jgi:hypothetical protein
MGAVLTVPFRCEVCRGVLHVRDGGRCGTCGKIMCRWHLGGCPDHTVKTRLTTLWERLTARTKRG